MPAAQNRRLNNLIDKSKAGQLTAAERRELHTLVERVDRQSFIRVANTLMKYLADHGRLPLKRSRARK
jgi:uncharacterized protein YnzC (UPF0291/DUF896 family)